MALPASPGSRRVRFDAFELDEESGELFRDSVPVAIPEQPLVILRALVERPGRLVTREALQRRLWPPDTVHVDFEHGLNAAVKRLRAVLGDEADEPRIVETVPRRGYRLKVRVEGQKMDAGPRPADSPLPSWRHGWAWAGALASTVALAAIITVATVSARLNRVQQHSP